jgi:hypothetical protein
MIMERKKTRILATIFFLAILIALIATLFNNSLTDNATHSPSNRVQVIPANSPARSTSALTLTGTILSPQGAPLPQARVWLATRDVAAYLHLPPRDDSITFLTDSDGRFELPSPSQPFILMVEAAGGYAECLDEDFTKSPSIRIQPWGHIEGVFMEGTRPAADQTIHMRRFRGGFDLRTDWIKEYATVKTDAQGRFRVQHVPQGAVMLSIRLDHPVFRHTRLTWVNVEPGKTSKVKIGGAGTAITGTATIPILDGTISTNAALWPTDLGPDSRPAGWSSLTPREKDAWLLNWYRTEEGADHWKRSHGYRFPVQPDGRFTAHDLAPGTYHFEITTQLIANPPKILAFAEKNISLPAAAGPIINVGVIELEAK